MESREREGGPPSALRTGLAYLVMLGATVGLYLAVRHAGGSLIAPSLPSGQPAFGAGGVQAQDHLVHVLIALGVILLAARGLGRAFRYIGQPPVVGEIVAGILLGPSLLGRVAPAAAQFLLPTEIVPHLGVLSQVGVVLFMFLIGVELDPRVLRRQGHATVAISHASIIVPFSLGAALALYLYPRLATRDVPFTAFSLFLGVSMSVTAFPVLARILTDRGMQKSRLGVVALTCAAVDDVSAWCLLALVVGVVQAHAATALRTAILTLAYLGFALLVLRPLMVRLARLAANRAQLSQGVMALAFLGLLASAIATDAIGIHALFGAFVLGAVIPHDSLLARELTNRLEDLVVVFFLPAFFAFTGMRTQIALVSGPSQWLLCGLIILCASAGKFGGSAIAARLVGQSWRDATALGVLMNTRGLMELVVLNLGFELRVISPTLFTMLVLMAVATTFATTPVLDLLTRSERRAAAVAASGTQRPVTDRREGFLVPISNPEGVRGLVELATAATRAEDPRPRVLALVRRPGGGVRTGLTDEAPAESPILAAALAEARAHGATVDGEVRWTRDPAADIVEAARDPAIRWLLLGYHRPVFGDDLLGGVIRQVFDRARDLAVDVGVVIQRHDRALTKLVAVVDDSDDGRAALDLALRLAHDGARSLRLVLVPQAGGQPEPRLQEMVRRAGRRAGRWLDTDTLSLRNAGQLLLATQGDLVLLGGAIADELGLPLAATPDGERSIVVLRGGARDEAGEESEAKAG